MTMSSTHTRPASEIEPVILRVALDVNVWVDHYLALSKGRQGSAAQILVGGAFAGTCRHSAHRIT
jgi:hypothetical protein